MRRLVLHDDGEAQAFRILYRCHLQLENQVYKFCQMKKQFYFSVLLALCALLLMSEQCEKNNPHILDPSEEAVELPYTPDENPEGRNDGQEEPVDIAPIRFNFSGNYEDLWKRVDSLQNLGLYNSALTVVDAIFNAARSEENVPQVIKSVIHKMKYNAYITEDDYVVALNELNGIASTASFPLKQIIHSITAQTYWGFYQQHRWQFMQRSETVNFDNSDIRTWDLTRISRHVYMHYMLSLENADSLQHAPLEDFKEILIDFSSDDLQRPTLYDFLAHQALNFFENTEAALVRPADKFLVKGTSYFDDAATFLTTPTDSDDSLSNELYATKIFKRLTSFHSKSGATEAFVDLELRRLQFAKLHSVEEEKDSLYLRALERLSSQYKGNEVYAEIRFKVAEFLNGRGDKFSVSSPQYQWDKKRAMEVCDEAISAYPESMGAEQCRSLRMMILDKNLSFAAEASLAPNTPGKMQISYKNVDSLYFKVVKVNWDYFYKQQHYGEELLDDLLKKPMVKHWDQALTNRGDYQLCTTEIKVPENEFGQYVILASYDKTFRVDTNAIAYASYWVTNLSYTYRNNDDGTVEAIVTDRESGEPLRDVKASVFISKYNYALRKYEVVMKDSYRSDQNGMFTISTKEDYRYFYIDLEKGNDRYNNLSQLYQYKNYEVEKEYSTTHFFTDRKIYRPGQTIYFKGIRIHHNGDQHTLETGKSSTVEFYDANYQKVSELVLTTNEYGTFSGSFTAPTGALNGSMRIQDPNGSTYVTVEEYKRPKFEVEFEPVAGVFKIGEKIRVSGTAKAYAGSNIDGADVQFRVTRSCAFSTWAWYRWGYYPQSSVVEIKNGVMKTDEEGKFIVEFEAVEDPSVNKEFFPTYNYSITADVTDVNGETHSSSTWVKVGYNCLNLGLSIPETVECHTNNRFRVNSTNLMGEKIAAKGNIKVNRLEEPEHLFREALWSAPDIQNFTKEEYRKLFPHDPYGDEHDYTKYKRLEEVLNAPFNTQANDSIDFTGMHTWKPGRYLIEMNALDSFGVNVQDIRYITVLDKESRVNPLNEVWQCTALKTSCEPGEEATFLISSAAEKLKVLYEIEHRGKIIHREFITLHKSQQKISIPIKEEYRGNLTVHFCAVRFGRSHVTRHDVYVPYSNKALDVEFETFRNKLLPGAKEEWKIKIKGPKGEQVAAEMMTAMYDASLDAFVGNSFYMNVFNSYYSNKYWYSNSFRQVGSQYLTDEWNVYLPMPVRNYDRLNWWGHYVDQGNYAYNYRYMADAYDGNIAYDVVTPEALEVRGSREEAPSGGDNAPAPTTVAANATYAWSGNEQTAVMQELKNTEDQDKRNNLGNIEARSNLNETAFFYPQLETNEKGEVIFSFTMPEALTRWKFLGMAHTKDLKTGYIQEEIVTQKELMVVPNAPRFLREGDKMTFTAKVSNLSEEELSGSAQLMLFDALTMRPVDSLFGNLQPIVDFTAAKGQSSRLAWDISVPSGIGAITYRVVARASNFTDGEEMALPILSNRMLVTESMPLPSKGVGTKDFKFEKLLNSASSTSIRHHKLTLEYTSNPAWYAIQAMPYMMEYPYECAEQTFTRYYSNAIASHLVNSSPKIKTVFESWKQSSPEAFLSNLERNQELKSLMLEETPWVLDAQDEGERKKRVALLFDLNKMDNELSAAIRKLQKMQVSNGGWPWFPGMPDSRYITQHIVTGMGHLDHLGVKNVREERNVWSMVQNGVNYLDQRLIEDYEWLKKHDPYYLTEQHIGELQVQYLYARSYFRDLPMSEKLKEAYDYYQKQAATYWKNFNLYNEGMIALEAQRFEVKDLPTQIMASIKERAIVHEELGMYWKDNVWGYYWYEAPIETQALLIEAFDEVSKDATAVEEAKVWLLKQKQTTDWKTTKATTEAVYALLLRGSDLLANTEQVEVKVNGKVIDPAALGAKVEAGTGYFKTSWSADAIEPEMGNVTVTRKTEGVSWGAMYWQYFEDLDKITTHETPLKLKKALFLVQNTDRGPVITPITENQPLKPGDKVRVRIELRTDRDMEYVHMKDMRAAGFEPVNVFSRYKWQDGLGYYESTKDAATNFFMDYLPKGTYVFEYDLRVSHFGDFSNGIATIQSMYAPEFTSHSEGIRVKVEEGE